MTGLLLGHDGRVDVRKIGGLDAFDLATEAEGGRIVFSHEVDFGVGLDVLFESGGPEDAVDDEAAVVGIEKVLGSSLGGVEDAGFFAVLGLIVAGPGGGAGLLCRVGGRAFGHTIERLAFGENGEGFIGNANVGTSHAEGIVLDADENGVLFLRFDELDAGGLLVVSSVVAHPGVAEDLMAKALLVFVAAVFEVEAGIGFALGNLESVGGSAQTDDGTATIDVVSDVLHLLIGQIQETGENHHEIGILEGFESFDIGSTGFDVTLFIHSKQNSRFETLMLGENAGEGGTGFLGAVFVVRGDKDDVFSFPGSFATFVGDLTENWNNCNEKEQEELHKIGYVAEEGFLAE